MHYLIAGIAKTGTTALFTSLKQALPANTETFFEPNTQEQFNYILSRANNAHTLTKALIGNITSAHIFIYDFHPHILIVRDPRDQIISELLYRFYEFKLNKDAINYAKALALLEGKVHNPASLATIELFNQVSRLTNKPGMERINTKLECLLNYRNTFQPFVLNYEDFIDGNTTTLEKYLGFSIPIQPNVDNEYKRVTRTKSYGEWQDWFTHEDIYFINTQVGTLIEELGYKLVEQPALADSLSIKTTLNYIEQFRP